MNIIIPLGGIGSRFRDAGYSYPKPFIKVLGKEILFWLLDCLDIQDEDHLYIPYDSKLNSHNFRGRICLRYPALKDRITFIELDKQTRGAADTITICAGQIVDKQSTTIVLDGDTFYTDTILEKARLIKDCAGAIFYFNDTQLNPIFSYIYKDDKGNVVSIAEKRKISDNACVGAYYFTSAEEILKLGNYILSSDEFMSKGEYYISDLYRYAISIDLPIKSVEVVKHYCLGTPDQVKLFTNTYPYQEMKRFCFDIDNTLVTAPRVKGDYKTVEPIKENIEVLRNLYNKGHYIILYTARRMKTFEGDVQAVINDIGDLTKETMKEFGIPYHEIHFGKPYANYYIDDLSVDANNDIEKELGYYNLKIEPRKFNTITRNADGSITKSSTNPDFAGEIYYYHHLPIADLFPALIKYDMDKKAITIEECQGIVMSELYTTNSLTEQHIDSIFAALTKLHNVSNEDKIAIYDNYAEKLKKRYNSYEGYAKFADSQKVFEKLLSKLEEYEKSDKGKQTVIHGDPVLTNIIWNPQDGGLKFIDMRGRVGGTNTIGGDCFYDYAKLLQSLYGYDFILTSKKIKFPEYNARMIQYYENLLINKFGVDMLNYIRIIMASLLFTLIPLHDNEKCYEYFDLCKKVLEKVK